MGHGGHSSAVPVFDVIGRKGNDRLPCNLDLMSMDRYGVLFTVDEVARYFRVSRSTVMKWIYSGRMDCVRISARELRVSESQIVAFMDDCRTHAGITTGIILDDGREDVQA